MKFEGGARANYYDAFLTIVNDLINKKVDFSYLSGNNSVVTPSTTLAVLPLNNDIYNIASEVLTKAFLFLFLR